MNMPAMKLQKNPPRFRNYETTVRTTPEVTGTNSTSPKASLKAAITCIS